MIRLYSLRLTSERLQQDASNSFPNAFVHAGRPALIPALYWLHYKTGGPRHAQPNASSCLPFSIKLG